jgi:hypothetical protein
LSKLLGDFERCARSEAEYAAFLRAVIQSLIHGSLPLDDTERAKALNLTPQEDATTWPRLAGWSLGECGYRHPVVDQTLKQQEWVRDDCNHLRHLEQQDFLRHATGEIDDNDDGWFLM